MTLISPEYLAQQREMHARQSHSYGISGGKWAKHVHNLAVALEAKSLLDYGCGQGTLKTELLKLAPEYDILEYDPAIPGKDTRPLRVDLVVCGDVMEHIEPECLYAVLDDIQDIARVAVFFVIATQPAVKHLPDGRNTHLIVEPGDWWLPKLTLRWRPLVYREFGNGAGFVFTGKTR